MKRTPEEIKKGLEVCSLPSDTSINKCFFCPYKNMPNCSENMNADALAYTKQLEEREWELFDLLSSAWFTKACYFKQKNGTVYSRMSGEYMTFDQAIDEFAHDLVEATQFEAQVPKWISVEERLPEVSDVVLVIANGKPREHITLHNALLIASYWGEEGWIADGFVGWDKLAVSHWMPLPEGPKEG